MYDSLHGRIDRSQQLRREAERLLAQTATHHTEMSVLMGESASAIRRSRCLAPRRISGGVDDSGLIIEALSGGAAICAECIAQRTGVRIGRLTLLMGRIGETSRLRIDVAVCGACLNGRRVYRIPGHQ
jgi:hypothetical protein